MAESATARGPAARRAKRAAFTGERLAKYLANAGAWYYERYMPSAGKLRAWLERRANGDAAALESAMAALAPLVCEQAVLDARVRALLERGKSRRWAESKLRLAKFTPDDIAAALDAYAADFSSWATYEPLARRKLKSLSDRGKTRREAEAALSAAFPQFGREARALAAETYASRDPEADFARAAAEAVRKFGAATPQARAKVFRKLVARGFSFDQARRAAGEGDPEREGEGAAA